jgi:hypothetical protein
LQQVECDLGGDPFDAIVADLTAHAGEGQQPRISRTPRRFVLRAT